MPTATKTDATSLRPVPEPAAPPKDSPRTHVPEADRVCTTCGELYRGHHSCPSVHPNSHSVFMAPMRAAGALGTREDIQAELDGIAFSVRAFHIKQPDQVMRECAAYSARLTEMCVLLHRVESLDRQYTRVRTQQVERWLTELDRQFKIASRLVEVARQDLELMR